MHLTRVRAYPVSLFVFVCPSSRTHHLWVSVSMCQCTLDDLPCRGGSAVCMCILITAPTPPAGTLKCGQTHGDWWPSIMHMSGGSSSLRYHQGQLVCPCGKPPHPPPTPSPQTDRFNFLSDEEEKNKKKKTPPSTVSLAKPRSMSKCYSPI